MKKITIAVLFGGCSDEYDISLQSAYAVIKHLDLKKYTPVYLGITREGDWYRYYGDVERIQDDTWFNEKECITAMVSPNRSSTGLIEIIGNSITETVLDCALPVLHGKNGEDGTVQGLLELAGIPIVGCDTISSTICMDKYRAHKLAESAGILCPKSFVFVKDYSPDSLRKQAEELGYPVFVKPLRSGSSFGISKVNSSAQLLDAINKAFQYDSSVIVEESIDGIEIGCAIIGNDKLVVGELDEIEITGDFFDFKEKYSLATAKIHLPARVNSAKSKKIKELAQRVYTTLGCRGFARVDMFLTKKGQVLFNEVNTIPGFTSHSRYPNMLKAIGWSFEQILDQAIALAVQK